jgi:hypothetical protein
MMNLYRIGGTKKIPENVDSITEVLLKYGHHKVYQLLAHGHWFSPGTPASSTTKTGRHDIAEILLKVALNTINQSEISLTRPTLIHTFNSISPDCCQVFKI